MSLDHASEYDAFTTASFAESSRALKRKSDSDIVSHSRSELTSNLDSDINSKRSDDSNTETDPSPDTTTHAGNGNNIENSSNPDAERDLTLMERQLIEALKESGKNICTTFT